MNAHAQMIARMAQAGGDNRSADPTGEPSATSAAQGDGLSRRRFFKLAGFSGLALGAGPLLAASDTAPANDDAAKPASTPAPAAASALKPHEQPEAFVHIDAEGIVTIMINRLEFGQGSHTGLAMVLAEELDADWSRVRARLAPAGDAYKDPAFGMQMTGGSRAIQGSFTQYREIGARARAMLVAAAAQAWNISPAEVRAAQGRLQGPSGQQAGYGEFSEAAAMLPVPASVVLKPVRRFSIIGKPTGRLDAHDKATGQQQFGIDVTRPGMKTVLIARPPAFGGKVASFDAGKALAVRGVVHVMQVDLDRGATGIAVVGDGYWPAKTGRDALDIVWEEPGDPVDSAALATQFTALLGRPGITARAADLSQLEAAPQRIKAQYTFPYLAHAPMEPLNAVMEMTGEGDAATCEVWTGTQFQTIDQATVAQVLGIAPAQVTIHTQFAGGGFGRRATPTSDYLADTARVMKAWRAEGKAEPLRLVWSREDDIRGGYYRPLTMHGVDIGLDEQGNVVGWQHRIVSQSILSGTPFEPMMMKDGIDATTTEGVADTAYDLPVGLSVHHPQVAVPVLWWRAVGHTHTAFVMETLIDRIAHESGQNPVSLRRKLLAAHPRHLKALDLAIMKSGYGIDVLPEGQAWGVALHESFGSVAAIVVRVSVADGRPVIHALTSAIHCNLAVNPSSIEAQLQGSALMAIGTTLEGAEITFEGGKVKQGNFNDYIVARMPDMPPVDVHIVPSTDAPTGVGEPGLPPVAPAIANALFALTGKPVESLPIRLT